MDVKDIERSIIKTFKSKIYAKFLRAIKEYSLVEDGDSICVCISGGKDSFLMAKCFQELKRHSKFQFDVKFVVMNPGYRKEHLDKIKNNLKLLNIEAEIFESNIFEDIKSYDSICYFCARKRRGFLYAKAKELIESFRKIDKNIDIHIFKSSENINIDAVLGYKDSTGFHSFLDEYND